MRALLCLLLAVGCSAPSSSRDAVHAALSGAWADAGLPGPGACRPALVVSAEPPCGGPVACYVPVFDVVHIREGFEPETHDALLVHEYAHAFSVCAGLGLDRDHANPDVWMAPRAIDGASATALALERLGLLPSADGMAADH